MCRPRHCTNDRVRGRSRTECRLLTSCGLRITGCGLRTGCGYRLHLLGWGRLRIRKFHNSSKLDLTSYGTCGCAGSLNSRCAIYIRVRPAARSRCSAVRSWSAVGSRCGFGHSHCRWCNAGACTIGSRRDMPSPSRDSAISRAQFVIELWTLRRKPGARSLLSGNSSISSTSRSTKKEATQGARSPTVEGRGVGVLAFIYYLRFFRLKRSQKLNESLNPFRTAVPF